MFVVAQNIYTTCKQEQSCLDHTLCAIHFVVENIPALQSRLSMVRVIVFKSISFKCISISLQGYGRIDCVTIAEKPPPPSFCQKTMMYVGINI